MNWILLSSLALLIGTVMSGCQLTTNQNQSVVARLDNGVNDSLDEMSPSVKKMAEVEENSSGKTPEIAEPRTWTFNSSELADAAEAFQFIAEIPIEWKVEYVPGSQAINFYNPAADGTTLEQSQIFVKFFEASQFLTLSTVTIHSQEEFTVNGRPTVRYDIEKLSSARAFPSQPTWRNERHFVTDIRATDSSSSVFYVFGQRPNVSDTLFDSFLQSLEFFN